MLDQSFYRFISVLAHASAAVIMPWYRSGGMDLQYKSDDTPVTRADRDAESMMRKMIQAGYPQHGIVGEEYGDYQPDAEYKWILDPIDGTKSFAGGSPLFGTLIGLLYEGQPVLGAIHLPVLGQLFVGDGGTTTLNGVPVRMREIDSLGQATLLTTDVLAIERYQDAGRFEELHRSVRLFRTWGDCYAYTLLAGGWADIALDPVMNPWDVLPLVPVIFGAGGLISAWDGSDVVSGDTAVAAAPRLHEQVLKILNR